jgi:predicted nucleic acid-binding protein
VDSTREALPRTDQRRRLSFLIDRLQVTPHPREPAAEIWPRCFEWLERHAEHAPDFADAHLCVLAAFGRARIWTYDREFTSVWRKPDGRKLALVAGALDR